MLHCLPVTLLRLALLGLIFTNALAATERKPAPPLRIGVSHYIVHDDSATDAEIGFRMMLNDLVSEANERVDLKVYESTESAVRAFKEGQLDLVYINSLKYLDLERSGSVHPFARYVVQIGPKLKQRYQILVRKDRQAKNLADLQGTKLSMPPGHIVGRRFLETSLLEAQLPVPERFFSEIQVTDILNEAIVDLFFGKVDVVVTTEHAFDLTCEMNPQVCADITPLISSQPLLHAVVAGRLGYPEQRRQRIESLLIREEYPSRTRHLMSTFRVKRFQRLEEGMLKEVKTLRETYRALSQQSP
jgi:ABC-type phosphate/phosphonate transport system substrate-binding protein